MSENTKLVMIKALDNFMRLAITIVIAISAWSMLSIVNNNSRLTAIETTRFTSTDGLSMQLSIMSAIEEGNKDIAVIKTKIDYMSEKK